MPLNTSINLTKKKQLSLNGILPKMKGHLLVKFPEIFDIKKWIVIGDNKLELIEAYSTFEADMNVKIGVFFKPKI
jgi:hypothetical protein